MRSILFEKLANSRKVSAELVLVSVAIRVGAVHLQVFAVVSSGRNFITVGEVAKRFHLFSCNMVSAMEGFNLRKRATPGTPVKKKGTVTPTSPPRASKQPCLNAFEKRLAEVDTNKKVDFEPTAASASNGDEPSVLRVHDNATSSPEVTARCCASHLFAVHKKIVA